MTHVLLTAAMDFFLLRSNVNENFRVSDFLLPVVKTALFTFWDGDADGAPERLYSCTGTYAATLPAANHADAILGRPIRLKNNGVGNITITRAGSDTVDGGTTLVIATTASVMLVSDGTSEWMIIADA